jgi:hypothetical protein
MTKTKGALLIARNNEKIDYVKQSLFLAKRIKKYLNIPVSVITDSPRYLNNLDTDKVFDKIIELEQTSSNNTRRYYDGSISSYTANFKNDIRYKAYDLSPYNETLLLDTDFILCNDIFKNCFDSANDFLIYKASSDISKVRDESEFQKISDYTVDFYWATVVFFRKTELNQIFFDLVGHIQDEWEHYRRIYQIKSSLFRNDYAFSIAIHIMNGFQEGSFAEQLPGVKLYSIDKDILWKLNDNEMIFLVEKKDYLGEYTILRTKNQNVHVMNKFSLGRLIDQESNNV